MLVRGQLAEEACGAETFSFDELDVLDELRTCTGGRGPDSSLEPGRTRRTRRTGRS